jgi:hypothetical protein
MMGVIERAERIPCNPGWARGMPLCYSIFASLISPGAIADWGTNGYC